MMNRAAAIAVCFRIFCVMTGDLNILLFPIAVQLLIFIQVIKFLQMQFTQLLKVYWPEPMLNANGIIMILKNYPKPYKKGLITEDDINKHLMRVLIGRFDLGEMDDDSIGPLDKNSDVGCK